MVENTQNNPHTSTASTGSSSIGEESTHKETHSHLEPGALHDTPENQNKSENFGIEILKIVILAIIIVTPIRVFIAQPFIVSGASMDDSFSSGQYLIVDQLSYRLHEPDRGDVVVFRFPLEPSKFFIKRIIGLPYDRVILQGKSTIIINEEHPDGLVLDEMYVSPERARGDSFSTTLGEGEYFVMGDNRRESSDSRAWGSLDKEYIVGQAFIRLFPITEFSILPGQ